MVWAGTTPTPDVTTNYNSDFVIRAYPNAATDGFSFRTQYHDAAYYSIAASAYKSMDTGGATWSTTGSTAAIVDNWYYAAGGTNQVDSPPQYRTVIFENDGTNQRWRWKMRANDDTTVIFTSGWVLWSDTRLGTAGHTHRWLTFGDGLTNYYYFNADFDYIRTV